jgi:hypothetical protein
MMLYSGLAESFLTMIFGFYFWYHNLQQYQDKLIKYEALKVEAAFPKNTTDIKEKTESKMNES